MLNEEVCDLSVTRRLCKVSHWPVLMIASVAFSVVVAFFSFRLSQLFASAYVPASMAVTSLVLLKYLTALETSTPFGSLQGCHATLPRCVTFQKRDQKLARSIEMQPLPFIVFHNCTLGKMLVYQIVLFEKKIRCFFSVCCCQNVSYQRTQEGIVCLFVCL